MNVHAKYIIGILVSIIVLIAAGWLTGITDVADKMQFGLAMSSIILAVFTIFFTVTSNANLPHTVNELRGVTKKVTKATTDLQRQLKAIPQRFDTMETKIDAAMAARAKETVDTDGVQPTASDLDKLAPIFVKGIPPFGLSGIYAASLSLAHRKPLDVDVISALLGFPDDEYLAGFLVATRATGLIKADIGDIQIVEYVHPTLTGLILDKYAASSGEDKDKLERHFGVAIPQRTEDGD